MFVITTGTVLFLVSQNNEERLQKIRQPQAISSAASFEMKKNTHTQYFGSAKPSHHGERPEVGRAKFKGLIKQDSLGGYNPQLGLLGPSHVEFRAPRGPSYSDR